MAAFQLTVTLLVLWPLAVNPVGALGALTSGGGRVVNSPVAASERLPAASSACTVTGYAVCGLSPVTDTVVVVVVKLWSPTLTW